MTKRSEPAWDKDQLLALHRVAKLVTASLDLDPTLEAIVNAARELTCAEQSAIFLLDSEGLVLRFARGAIAAAIGERVRPSEGLVGLALQEGRTMLIPDILEESRRARPALDSRTGIRAYLVAPLIWRAERLGVVTASSSSPGSLTESDAHLIAELGELAAAAVAHARAYGEEQFLRAESQEMFRQLAEQTEQLERVQRQLVQNEKLTAIGQLAHGIAHEMNTPLGVIISNLAVLERYAAELGAVAGAAREAVDTLTTGDGSEGVGVQLGEAVRGADLDYILGDLPALISESTASAERAAEIVRSLTVFAQRDGDHPSSVDVAQVLEAAVTLSWNALKQRAEVKRDYATTPPVLGHASELTQVFVHLLLNAAAALEARPGTVTLATRWDGTSVAVAISDTGCGISEEHLSRIFEPFFTTRPPGQGTGMGLSVCHGIVTRHGGTIRAESTPGQGATFTVSLPAVGSMTHLPEAA